MNYVSFALTFKEASFEIRGCLSRSSLFGWSMSHSRSFSSCRCNGWGCKILTCLLMVVKRGDWV